MTPCGLVYSCWCLEWVCCLLDFPESGGCRLLWITGNFMQIYGMSYPRSLRSAQAELWVPWVLCFPLFAYVLDLHVPVLVWHCKAEYRQPSASTTLQVFFCWCWCWCWLIHYSLCVLFFRIIFGSPWSPRPQASSYPSSLLQRFSRFCLFTINSVHWRCSWKPGDDLFLGKGRLV